MLISLKILESNKEISEAILSELSKQLDNYLKKALQQIRQNLPDLVRNAIYRTSEYNSLISPNGKLRLELGIENANSVQNIIDIWTNNVVVEYNGPTIISSSIRASFSVSMIRNDYADVLSSSDALVIDNLRGYQLPWLEWLLLEGNKIIISKQQVQFGPSKFSRTGFAIMKPSNKSWKVPSEFSGTSSDNWITRAIDSADSDIEDLMNRAFK